MPSFTLDHLLPEIVLTRLDFHSCSPPEIRTCTSCGGHITYANPYAIAVLSIRNDTRDWALPICFHCRQRPHESILRGILGWHLSELDENPKFKSEFWQTMENRIENAQKEAIDRFEHRTSAAI